MENFKKGLAAFLLAVVTTLAQANANYNFSYTFQDGSVITGSFSGNAYANLIVDLADIHFSFDGVPVTGPISGYSAPFNYASSVASFDGKQNQLFFANSDFSSFFYSIDGGSIYGPSGTNLYAALVSNGLAGACDSITGNAAPPPYTCGGLIGSSPRWSISAVSEPSVPAMLLFGSGLLCVATRRRKG